MTCQRRVISLFYGLWCAARTERVQAGGTEWAVCLEPGEAGGERRSLFFYIFFSGGGGQGLFRGVACRAVSGHALSFVVVVVARRVVLVVRIRSEWAVPHGVSGCPRCLASLFFPPDPDL